MTKKIVRKAIIPAAGYGLRLLPITKVIPKEMLPIEGRPMIQSAWQEAVVSGLKEIAIVIHPEKEVIKKYFSPSPLLEKEIKKRGDKDLYSELLALSRLAKITFIYQEKRLGLGHAILSCRDFVADEPFALLNPDNIYVGPEPCLSLLLKAWAEVKTSLVLLGRIKREETAKVAVAKVKGAEKKGFYLIEDLEEKPGPKKAFSRFGVWGRAVFEPEIMAYLAQTRPDKDGEIQLTEALKLWIKDRLLYGILCPLKRYDAGEWPGFLQVNLALRSNSRQKFV